MHWEKKDAPQVCRQSAFSLTLRTLWTLRGKPTVCMLSTVPCVGRSSLEDAHREGVLTKHQTLLSQSSATLRSVVLPILSDTGGSERFSSLSKDA